MLTILLTIFENFLNQYPMNKNLHKYNNIFQTLSTILAYNPTFRALFAFHFENVVTFDNYLRFAKQ